MVEKLRLEKAAVEEQLRVARDERAKLQRDINTMQQQAEGSWATERMENALLRERINDIAAEVAKLAIQLEGPNSAIEAMLAAEPAVPAKAAKPANGGAQRRACGLQPSRRRRNARRTHPRAAVPRLPRPPAGGVTVPVFLTRLAALAQRGHRLSEKIMLEKQISGMTKLTFDPHCSLDTIGPHFVNRGL